MKHTREQLEEAFRENRLAAEQRSTSIQTVPAGLVHRSADGWELVADHTRLFAAKELEHEQSAGSEVAEVLACRVGAGGYELRTFTVIPNMSPQRVVTGESAAPPPPAFPAAVLAGESHGRSGVPMPPIPGLLDTPESCKNFRDSIEFDKDTHRVRTVLVGWRDKKIRNYQQVQRHIVDAHDPDRVRRMIVEVTPEWAPTPKRRGFVPWGDVHGIPGFVPYAQPIVAVGTIAELREPSDWRLTVALTKVQRPSDGSDLPFLKAGKRLVELKYESAEVGDRLPLFWTRRPVRMKLLVRRELQLGGKFEVTLADLYAEGWDPGERERRVAWVTQQLLRDPPPDPGWIQPIQA